MKTTVLFFLSCHLTCIFMYSHIKPIAKQVWTERCSRNSMILNDCNWCTCDKTHKYVCTARDCSEVDKFEHFNDAIKNIEVGMEGRGSWRTTKTPCQPGISYQKDKTLCICGEDGNWPNPVCHNIFRTLAPVEVSDDNVRIYANTKDCTPNKYYLIGCNLCFCADNRRLHPQLCIRYDCKDILKTLDTTLAAEPSEVVDEIYAECSVNTNYKLGCKSCTCLRNNSLLCDDCTDITSNVNLCNKENVGNVFPVDCNSCYCNEEDIINCTVKNCIFGSLARELAQIMILPDTKFTTVEKPSFIQQCIPGTKFKNNCNTCYCFSKNGVKVFGCTLNKCPNSDDGIFSTCNEGTVYERDCHICHCVLQNEVKTEICVFNQKCMNQAMYRGESSISLQSGHGYCEPFAVYKKDCNECKCAEDGRSVQCTVKNCDREKIPLSLAIVPVLQNVGSCPEGHSYRIDCNTCVCLSNGNVICSTAVCKKKE